MTIVFIEHPRDLAWCTLLAGAFADDMEEGARRITEAGRAAHDIAPFLSAGGDTGHYKLVAELSEMAAAYAMAMAQMRKSMEAEQEAERQARDN